MITHTTVRSGRLWPSSADWLKMERSSRWRKSTSSLCQSRNAKSLTSSSARRWKTKCWRSCLCRSRHVLVKEHVSRLAWSDASNRRTCQAKRLSLFRFLARCRERASSRATDHALPALPWLIWLRTVWQLIFKLCYPIVSSFVQGNHSDCYNVSGLLSSINIVPGNCS